MFQASGSKNCRYDPGESTSSPKIGIRLWAGTNYRRLIDGRSIDISLGGIHNIVVGSDIDTQFQEQVSVKGLSSIMADDTGVKQKRGHKGELRVAVG